MLKRSTTEVIRYTDDLSLIPDHDANRDLQNAIDDTKAWCDENTMIVNSKKSRVPSISNQNNNHISVPAVFTMKAEYFHVDKIVRKT